MRDYRSRVSVDFIFKGPRSPFLVSRDQFFKKIGNYFSSRPHPLTTYTNARLLDTQSRLLFNFGHIFWTRFFCLQPASTELTTFFIHKINKTRERNLNKRARNFEQKYSRTRGERCHLKLLQDTLKIGNFGLEVLAATLQHR
jgi:hypothetical protein